MPQLRHWAAALVICAFLYFVLVFLCALTDGCALIHMTPTLR
jgi:hypothetical protein